MDDMSGYYAMMILQTFRSAHEVNLEQVELDADPDEVLTRDYIEQEFK